MKTSDISISSRTRTARRSRAVGVVDSIEMSDGLSVHCVDTTDVVAVDTTNVLAAHTKDVLSADATDVLSAHNKCWRSLKESPHMGRRKAHFSKDV